MSVQEPSDYSASFAELLRRLGVEPVLVGALAAAIYRLTPRFTTDVDFMVRSFGDVEAGLSAQGYEVRAMAGPGEEPYLMFVRGKGVRVDLLLAETEYHRQALDRAVDGVLAIEDVIVSKLLAWRPRDQDDIDSIMSTAPEMDRSYIQQWSKVWEVDDRWSAMLTRHGSK